MRARNAVFALLAACHPASGPVAGHGVPFVGHGEVAPDAILSHWLDGSWSASELVDPRRGLVRFWTETGEVDPVLPDIQVHLCGAALDRALPVLSRSIADAVHRADIDERVACTNHECSFASVGEYEPDRIAIFDHRAGTPTTLVAYLEVARFSDAAEHANARVRTWATAEMLRPCD